MNYVYNLIPYAPKGADKHQDRYSNKTPEVRIKATIAKLQLRNIFSILAKTYL